MLFAMSNVRLWHLADVLTCADLRPLSGVKRTLTTTYYVRP